MIQEKIDRLTSDITNVSNSTKRLLEIYKILKKCITDSDVVDSENLFKKVIHSKFDKDGIAVKNKMLDSIRERFLQRLKRREVYAVEKANESLLAGIDILLSDFDGNIYLPLTGVSDDEPNDGSEITFDTLERDKTYGNYPIISEKFIDDFLNDFSLIDPEKHSENYNNLVHMSDEYIIDGYNKKFSIKLNKIMMQNPPKRVVQESPVFIKCQKELKSFCAELAAHRDKWTQVSAGYKESIGKLLDSIDNLIIQFDCASIDTFDRLNIITSIDRKIHQTELLLAQHMPKKDEELKAIMEILQNFTSSTISIIDHLLISAEKNIPYERDNERLDSLDANFQTTFEELSKLFPCNQTPRPFEFASDECNTYPRVVAEEMDKCVRSIKDVYSSIKEQLINFGMTSLEDRIQNLFDSSVMDVVSEYLNAESIKLQLEALCSSIETKIGAIKDDIKRFDSTNPKSSDKISKIEVDKSIADIEAMTSCSTCTGRAKFCLSSCGHIFCSECIKKLGEKCSSCAETVSTNDIIEIKW